MSSDLGNTGRRRRSLRRPGRRSSVCIVATIDLRGAENRTSESAAWFVRLCLVVVQPLDRRLDALDVLAYAL